MKSIQICKAIFVHFAIHPPACHASQPPPDQHQPSTQHHRPALPSPPHRRHQHPRGQPQRTAEEETHRETARGRAHPRGRTDGTAPHRRPTEQTAPPAAPPGLLPRSNGQPDSTRGQPQHPRQQRRTGDGNRERERERGRRERGSERKTALKAPPFDHLPDWRHQPRPGHPMTARGHQTATDGHTAEGEHPAPVLLLWSMQNQP